MKVLFNNTKIDDAVIDTDNVIVSQVMRDGGDSGDIAVDSNGRITFEVMTHEPASETLYYTDTITGLQFFVIHSDEMGYEIYDIDGNPLCVSLENREFIYLDEFVEALPEQPNCSHVRIDYAKAANDYIERLPEGTEFYIDDKRKFDNEWSFYVVLPNTKDEAIERGLIADIYNQIRQINREEAAGYLAEAITPADEHEREYGSEQRTYAYELCGKPLHCVLYYSVIRVRDGHDMPTSIMPDYKSLKEAKVALINQAEQYCEDNSLTDDETAEFMADAKYSYSFIDDVYKVFIAAEYDDGNVERVIL